MHIRSFHVYGNKAASHRSPMTILYKSRCILVLANVGPKMCKPPTNRGLTVSINQIRYIWAKLCIFVRFMCMAIKRHHTEAPWPFITKVGVAWFLPILGQKCVNPPKNRGLTVSVNQIRYIWAKLCIFVPFMCVAMKRYYTEAPWPFITKVWVAWSCPFWAKNVFNIPKNRSFCVTVKTNMLPMN